MQGEHERVGAIIERQVQSMAAACGSPVPESRQGAPRPRQHDLMARS